MRGFIRFSILTFVAVSLGACAHDRSSTTATTTNPDAVTAATPVPATEAAASLDAPNGSKVKGSFRFTQSAGSTIVHVELEGLKARSVHGLHIHENGNCAGAGFKSAGGHYNPMSDTHGGPMSEHKHFGDLGNVTADRHGHVVTDITINHNLLAGENGASAIGKSIVLHAGKDDLKSQPAGNSGDRIACGIISETK